MVVVVVVVVVAVVVVGVVVIRASVVVELDVDVDTGALLVQLDGVVVIVDVVDHVSVPCTADECNEGLTMTLLHEHQMSGTSYIVNRAATEFPVSTSECVLLWLISSLFKSCGWRSPD